MQNERIVTCVYCGMAYPDGTPRHGSEVLTEHIKICPKHPLRKSEEKIEKLKKALYGLIGISTVEELKIFELAIRKESAPEADKKVCLDAIHILLEIDGDQNDA